MKDIFNIVKVSDIDDVDCSKIIKKCFDKPNMINYYYPHIFMNRDKIDKEKLIKIFDESILNVKRDKHVEQTIKKYNVLTNILESLFLCVLDLDVVKNIQKFILFNFSKDANNITDILNNIIQEHTLFNLEQLLNDKIDNSHSVFIIEKIILHIKKDYSNSNIEKQTLTQYQILNQVQSYIFKQKYNPYVNKIINYNKMDLIKDYIQSCLINDSHDEYITNIIEIYNDIKHQCYDVVDVCDWNLYFRKVSDSLNIADPKEKIMKSLFRFSILNKIITINNEKITDKDTNDKNKINNLTQNLHSIIHSNKIDTIIVNSYINMIKNHCTHDKLVHLENIIKYFPTFGQLSKELIKIYFPKYFSLESTRYYSDIISRLNIISHKKLSVIDTIIDQQKKFADDLKITQIDNESKSIFDKDVINIFNVDHKYIDSSDYSGKVTTFTPELKAYNTFTNKWFDRHYSSLKKITINDYLSNGKVQINNTIINTNLIMLNTLFMFNNPTQSISIDSLKLNFSEDLVDHIVTTLEYYDLGARSDRDLVLNKSFFAIKQEVKVELIKKSDIKEQVDVPEIVSTTTLQSEAIECMILKTIKPIFKVPKDSLFEIVSKNSTFKFDQTLFEKCMKRLFEMDYYEIVDDCVVYVP